VSATSVVVACGAITPAPDAGDEGDATTDTTIDTSADVAFPDAALDSIPADASDATDVVVADAANDADAGIYFDASPDASGCTYYSDASCTTIPKPVSINVGCVAAPPTPQGGTIVSGVYHLTQVDWNAQYFDGGCPASSTWGGSLEICGNIIEHYDVNDVKSVFVGNHVYQTVSNQLELEQYCPSGPYFASFGYTATSTQVTINWGNPILLVETFTKQ
jgi:hypothetical protein